MEEWKRGRVEEGKEGREGEGGEGREEESGERRGHTCVVRVDSVGRVQTQEVLGSKVVLAGGETLHALIDLREISCHLVTVSEDRRSHRPLSN